MSESTTTQTTYTPYAAAKRINEALAEAGVEKVLPPQMFYNYTKGRVAKGKKPFIEYNRETGKIDHDVLVEWAVKYFTKQGVDLTV